VGPSGVGKDTLIKDIIVKYGQLFERKKSYTTRPQKLDEKTPDNFHFVTVAEFEKMVANDDFVEYRQKLGGHWYGTAKAELQRIISTGKIPIIEVDVQGAFSINAKAVEGNFLFIYPPSFQELRRRIGNRIETEQEFKIRISDAIKQLELANSSVLFTNRLVNDKLEDAISQFDTLIEALYFQEIKNIKMAKVRSESRTGSRASKESKEKEAK